MSPMGCPKLTIADVEYIFNDSVRVAWGIPEKVRNVTNVFSKGPYESLKVSEMARSSRPCRESSREENVFLDGRG